MKRIATVAVMVSLLTVVWAQDLCGGEKSTKGKSTTPRKSFNSLQNEETLLRDWTCSGKFRVETSGLHLIGNSQMTSKFKMADGSLLLIGYVANNRNLYVDVCGETIEFRSANNRGPESYGVAVARRGRTLIYGKYVNGKFAEQNKILISNTFATQPSKVSITSRCVGIPGARSDRFMDVQIRLLTASGNIIEP